MVDICAECGEPLTDEELHYYVCYCEDCESPQLHDWQAEKLKYDAILPTKH